jgi:hypothetical protein
MPAVELDRQSIEKRDFPIGRRGYDPAAVDAHLRALAVEVDELRVVLDSRAGESLGSTAGTQVQGILEAAERTAADIEQKATEDARKTRADAAAEAERTRVNAVEQAQAHVAAVAQATAVLIERVESMDGQSVALVESLRASASRLATDLSAVETEMAELYDAAAGRGRDTSPEGPQQDDPALLPRSASPTPSPPPPVPSSSQAPHRSDAQGASVKDGDLDGARLIALNMALNGDSRAATDRYLDEHYQLADRQKLLDEVYAAIEG